MVTPLEDIEFLTRSAHRVKILEELSEKPCERAEMQQQMDVSRATITRTLSEMEAKGWIKSEGWQYTLTPLGEIILSKISPMLTASEVVQKLSQVIEWLPIEAIDIDFRWFGNAEVTLATHNDASAPVRKVGHLLDGAEQIHTLTYTLEFSLIESHRQRLSESNQKFEIILSSGLYDVMRSDSSVAEVMKEIVTSENGTVYLHEDEYPLHLAVTEEAVGLLLTNDQGTFPAYIESHEETVISWAKTKFESYKADSVSLSKEDFSVTQSD